MENRDSSTEPGTTIGGAGLVATDDDALGTTEAVKDATPRPWKRGTCNYSSYAIDAANGRRICAVRFNRFDPADQPIAWRASEDILRAVNVHNELVATLHLCAETLTLGSKLSPRKAYDAARATLAKAGG